MTAPDKITELTDQDRANIIAHLSPELIPSGPLPSPNSVMMDWVHLRNALADRDREIERLKAELAAANEAVAIRQAALEQRTAENEQLQARLDALETTLPWDEFCAAVDRMEALNDR